MRQSEGSESLSMSLVCSCVSGIEGARMRTVYIEGWMMNNVLPSVVMNLITFPEYEHSLSRCECRGEEGRIH